MADNNYLQHPESGELKKKGVEREAWGREALEPAPQTTAQPTVLTSTGHP